MTDEQFKELIEVLKSIEVAVSKNTRVNTNYTPYSGF